MKSFGYEDQPQIVENLKINTNLILIDLFSPFNLHLEPYRFLFLLYKGRLVIFLVVSWFLQQNLLRGNYCWFNLIRVVS